MSITLEEIAKQAGVSRSTVSRVMNEHPNVDPTTRERVLAVAESLNYHIHLAARSLAAGRTRILGLVIPTGVSSLFTDPYFPILIEGIASTCNALDHSVMLWLAEPEYERRMIRQVMQGGLLDGVIIASARVGDPILDAIRKRGLPFILVGRLLIDDTASYVDVENKKATMDVITYLLRLGYSRIATITGPLDNIAGADRLDGYLTTLMKRNIAADHSLIAHGDFTEESGYLGMQQLLPFKPDAVFVANDTMAVGALRALRQAGKRVPDDIAIVGFDDMPFAANTEPPLTTMRQPVHRLGAIAAETLIDLISDSQAQPRRILLPTEMVIRASCGGSMRR